VAESSRRELCIRDQMDAQAVHTTPEDEALLGANRGFTGAGIRNSWHPFWGEQLQAAT
jgi:hypothetical protein